MTDAEHAAVTEQVQTSASEEGYRKAYDLLFSHWGQLVLTYSEQKHRIRELEVEIAAMLDENEKMRRSWGLDPEDKVVAAGEPGTASLLIDRKCQRMKISPTTERVLQLEAERDRLRELLTEVEWDGVSYDDPELVCAFCDNPKSVGHKSDCRLAQALSTPEKL